MRFSLKILALILAVLWLPATQHCMLEAADYGWSEHGDHHAEDCALACESEACQPVESASYWSASVRVQPASPAEIWVNVFWVCLNAPPASSAAPCAPTAVDPAVAALRCTWQFISRTALLPGAPDRLV